MSLGQSKKIEIENFSVYYNNRSSAEQTAEEIFTLHPYRFVTDKENPFIIDAGSNVGIAALYFYKLYPGAEIFCFEPDPNAFEKLKINMAANKIENVNLMNMAVSNKEGSIDFFGQIFVDSPDARGNSILSDWGLQREVSNTTKVKTVKLSSYIDREVDFLKLDIEGAEQQVLEDLDSENKFSYIKEIALEVHYSSKISHVNDINVIIDILKKNQFNVSFVERELDELLPGEVKGWVEKTKPRLFVVKAVKV